MYPGYQSSYKMRTPNPRELDPNYIVPAADVQGLKNQVLQLRRDLETRISAEERLKDINEQLRRRLEEYQRQNEENYQISETNRIELEQELEELSLQENDLRAEVMKLQQERKEYDEKLSKMTNQKGKAEDYGSQLSSFIEKNKQLEDELKDTQDKINKLSEQYNQAVEKSQEYEEILGRIYIPEDLEEKVESFYNNKIKSKYFNLFYNQVNNQKYMKLIQQRNKQMRNMELLRRVFSKWQIYHQHKVIDKTAQLYHQKLLEKRIKLQYYENWKKAYYARNLTIEEERVMTEKAYYYFLSLVFKHWKRLYNNNKIIQTNAPRFLLKRYLCLWRVNFDRRCDMIIKYNTAVNHYKTTYLMKGMNKLIPFLQKARIIKEQNQKSLLFWKNNQQLKTIKHFYMKVKYHKLYKSLKKINYHIRLSFVFNNWKKAIEMAKENMKHKMEMDNKCDRFIKHKFFIIWLSHISASQKNDEIRKKREIELLRHIMQKWHNIAKYRKRLEYFAKLIERNDFKHNYKLIGTVFNAWFERCKREKRNRNISDNLMKIHNKKMVNRYYRKWCRYIIMELMKKQRQKEVQLQQISQNSSALEEENMKLVTYLQELTREAAEMRGIIEKNKELKEETELGAKRAIECVQDLSKRIERTELLMEEERINNSKLHEKLHKLRNEKANSETESLFLSSHINELNRQLEDAVQYHNSLENQKTEVEKQLDELRKTNEQQLKETLQTSLQYRDLLQQHQEAIKKLEKEKDNVLNQNKDYQKKLEITKTELEKEILSKTTELRTTQAKQSLLKERESKQFGVLTNLQNELSRQNSIISELKYEISLRDNNDIEHFERIQTIENNLMKNIEYNNNNNNNNNKTEVVYEEQSNILPSPPPPPQPLSSSSQQYQSIASSMPPPSSSIPTQQQQQQQQQSQQQQQNVDDSIYQQQQQQTPINITPFINSDNKSRNSYITPITPKFDPSTVKPLTRPKRMNQQSNNNLYNEIEMMQAKIMKRLNTPLPK